MKFDGSISDKTDYDYDYAPRPWDEMRQQKMGKHNFVFKEIKLLLKHFTCLDHISLHLKAENWYMFDEYDTLVHSFGNDAINWLW